jgi:hypothetical protein
MLLGTPLFGRAYQLPVASRALLLRGAVLQVSGAVVRAPSRLERLLQASNAGGQVVVLGASSPGGPLRGPAPPGGPLRGPAPLGGPLRGPAPLGGPLRGPAPLGGPLRGPPLPGPSAARLSCFAGGELREERGDPAPAPAPAPAPGAAVAAGAAPAGAPARIAGRGWGGRASCGGGRPGEGEGEEGREGGGRGGEGGRRGGEGGGRERRGGGRERRGREGRGREGRERRGRERRGGGGRRTFSFRVLALKGASLGRARGELLGPGRVHGQVPSSQERPGLCFYGGRLPPLSRSRSGSGSESLVTKSLVTKSLVTKSLVTKRAAPPSGLRPQAGCAPKRAAPPSGLRPQVGGLGFELFAPPPEWRGASTFARRVRAPSGTLFLY